MAIDFSYLEGAAPQEENAPIKFDTAYVTIRVDADSLLLCDGEYIDQPFKVGALTKIQLPIGQHLLEFLYTEDPDIKIEKEVDFPESGKSYLVLIKGLKELVDAAAAEAKQKAEEEARKKAEAEAKRKAEEEARKKAEEEEAKRKAEEEAKRKAEEESKRKAEEEAEAKRKARAEAEAKNGTLNGHDYVDLGLPSGLKWATCNVGARSPKKYGDYYAWGETEIKSKYTTASSKTWNKSIGNISGNPAYDVARAKWGSSWRMPTKDDCQELIDECKWELVSEQGFIVTGPNGNSIFLPFGGAYCGTNEERSGPAIGEGTYGYIWSSTPSEHPKMANHLLFKDTFPRRISAYYDHERSAGICVRPVSE